MSDALLVGAVNVIDLSFDQYSTPPRGCGYVYFSCDLFPGLSTVQVIELRED